MAANPEWWGMGGGALPGDIQQLSIIHPLTTITSRHDPQQKAIRVSAPGHAIVKRHLSKPGLEPACGVVCTAVHFRVASQ